VHLSLATLAKKNAAEANAATDFFSQQSMFMAAPP
jgi:hypothetical protein